MILSRHSEARLAPHQKQACRDHSREEGNRIANGGLHHSRQGDELVDQIRISPKIRNSVRRADGVVEFRGEFRRRHAVRVAEERDRGRVSADMGKSTCMTALK
jgi:hypothetical protein